MQAQSKETLLYKQLKESGEIGRLLEEAQRTELFVMNDDEEGAS